MDKDDLLFEVDEIKQAEDVYEYTDLEDLSLIPPKKRHEDSVEDLLEKKAAGGMKVLGIATGVILALCVVAVGLYFLFGSLKKNTYAYNYNQGVLSYQEMKFEDAIKSFEKALTYKEAHNINERIYLYKCYKTIGQEDKAIQVLTEILQYEPYHIETITALAGYYYSNGKLDLLNELVEKYKGTQAESAVSSYMLDMPAVSHDSGKYNNSIEVVMYSSTGDNIYYTLDGSVPTSGDTLYTGPVTIGKGSTILKAVVINGSGITSAVAEYQYDIEFVMPDAPSVSPASGNYTENQKITVENITEGADAYYTLDGSVPTLQSEKYTEPIDMPGGNNIFSVAVLTPDGVSSNVVKRNYNLKVSEKYSFDASVEAIKYVLIKKQEINSNGTETADGKAVKFVYYAKRKVNNTEMYLMYYDIMEGSEYVRQSYFFGVDVQSGDTYKVVDVNGVLTPEEYK